MIVNPRIKESFPSYVDYDYASTPEVVLSKCVLRSLPHDVTILRTYTASLETYDIVANLQNFEILKESGCVLHNPTKLQLLASLFLQDYCFSRATFSPSLLGRCPCKLTFFSAI